MLQSVYNSTIVYCYILLLLLIVKVRAAPNWSLWRILGEVFSSNGHLWADNDDGSYHSKGLSGNRFRSRNDLSITPIEMENNKNLLNEAYVHTYRFNNYITVDSK